MARLTAERLRQIITVRIWGETRDDAAVLEHAARVVEAAEQLLHVLYKTSPPDPPWQEDEDALDAALEGTEGE